MTERDMPTIRELFSAPVQECKYVPAGYYSLDELCALIESWITDEAKAGRPEPNP